MDPRALQIAARFAAAVIPFKPKPHGPTETIGGKKYVLSTDGGPLGDAEDPAFFGDNGGGKFIDVPRPENKWRFLWVFDTDKKFVAMWRVTDGNEKSAGPASSYMAKVVHLEKKGQLNRVTHAEFQVIEREMRKREADHIKKLQEFVEENKDDLTKRADQLAKDYFEKHVAPLIERALDAVKKGAIPLGYKPAAPDLSDVQKTRGLYVHVMSALFKRELTEPKVEAYLKQHGVDPKALDIQAVQWAIDDIIDAAYEKYLPARDW